jgi:hypothetical protein
MKHLFNGVAIAAALAIAAPVWAQTGAPMTPSSRAPAGSAPAASAPAPAPTATKARAKRATHRRTARRGKARMAGSDSMANQLNAQELQRVQGGGRNLMAPGTLGGGYGQPSPTQGIPGGDQPSASSHPPPSR